MKMKGYLKLSLRFLLLLIIIVASISSCKDKDDIKPTDSPNVLVNNWIQEVMDEVYFWLENMRNPIASESDPEEYFDALLFKPTDRFSAIFPDFQELINSLQGVSKEAGYEILLVRESNDNENVLAFVSYIKKGSPAASKDVKRGDVITQINNQTLTLSNYQDLLQQRSNDHSITFFRYNPETETYTPRPTVELGTVQLAENPNFLDTLFTVGSDKIGYVVYHFFAPGIDGQPTRYDDQMDEIFGRFKAEGINHLIVDFRYNGGGFVSSAVNLASLIGPGVDNTSVFSKTKYNSFLMSFDQFQNVQTTFKTKSQNLGNSLVGNRVYVITSRRTASASELIINGLKPYMDVVIIGERTTGKNVGSVALEDEENPDNKYGLLPIVSKSFNSEDRSDYDEGFAPNVPGVELSQPVLLPLGDTNEYLLKLAIGQITGQDVDSRMKLLDRIDIGSSLEDKVRFGKMIEEKPDRY